VFDFIATHWEWLFGGLGASLAVFVLGLLIRRRSHAVSSRSEKRTRITTKNLEIHHNSGPNESRIREIVQDEIKLLFGRAEEEGIARADDFGSAFLARVGEQPADWRAQLQDPGSYLAVRTAIRSYVRSGDARQKNILLVLLMARVGIESRALSPIILDSALEAAGKLIPRQYKALGLLDSVESLLAQPPKSQDQIVKYLLERCLPYIGGFRCGETNDERLREEVLYGHLVLTGCCTRLSHREGYTFREVLSKAGLDSSRPLEYQDLQTRLEKAHESMKWLLTRWDFSIVRDLVLTPVGRAIARAHSGALASDQEAPPGTDDLLVFAPGHSNAVPRTGNPHG